MDIDRFIVRNEPLWTRTAELARRAGRRRDLTGAELDELVRSHQEISLHLSQARTSYHDPNVIRRLSVLVAASHAAIHGARVARFATVGRFFSTTFPAAVWTCRRQLLASALLFWGTGIVVAVLFSLAPERIDLVMPEDVQEIYVEEDFVSYYSESPSIVFFSQVTTNNMLVAMLAYSLGALLVIPGARILFENGAILGLVAGLFFTRGELLTVFLPYVMPHGLLELTAITFAGAAGMRVGWSVFSPGDRSRTEAVGDEGRRSVVVLLGTLLAFLVAGLIEGFVTGSPAVPPVLKVVVGVAAWAMFLAWALVRGREAHAAGFTGALEELRPTWTPIDPLAPVTVPRVEKVPALLVPGS